MATKEIGDRLLKVMKMMRLKNYEFAEKFSLSPVTLSRYKAGLRVPEPNFLIALAKAQVNVNWLLTGEGTMQIVKDFDGWMKERLEQKLKIVDSKTGLIEAPTIDYTRTVNFSILGEISAGPREHIEDFRRLGESVEIPRNLVPGNTDKYMAFRVNGHSMEPNIMHEDIVLLMQTYDWEFANGKVGAVRAGDGVTLKKIILDPQNSRVILQPFNLDFDVQILDADQGDDAFLIGVLSLQLRLFDLRH